MLGTPKYTVDLTIILYQLIFNSREISVSFTLCKPIKKCWQLIRYYYSLIIFMARKQPISWRLLYLLVCNFFVVPGTSSSTTCSSTKYTVRSTSFCRSKNVRYQVLNRLEHKSANNREEFVYATENLRIITDASHEQNIYSEYIILIPNDLWS